MCFGYIRRFFVQQGWFSGFYNFSSRKMPAREKTALVIVDVQNDFISGTLALSKCAAQQNGEEVVAPINSLLKEIEFDKVVYTLDWHPADHISFITNKENFKLHDTNKNSLENIQIGQPLIFEVDGKPVEQLMWPPHCIQETHGAELHKDLNFLSGSIVIKKGAKSNIDSYSAFFDNKRLSETELQAILRENEITKVFVCGLALDICVNFTVSDAHDLGFKTYLIHDACRAIDLEGKKAVIDKFTKMGVQIIKTDDVQDFV